MAKAGYCSACQANVWLMEDGGCASGHPAECVSGIYETVPAPPAATALAAPLANRKKRPWLVPAVLVAVVVVLGLVGSQLFRLTTAGAGIADDWRRRLAVDYPGWEPVGFNFFAGSGGTTYRFTLIPPDADYSVAVVYASREGQEPESQDEILRADGAFHERAESLLDYIDENYYAEGKSTVTVTSDEAGDVIVDWVKSTNVGPFSSRIGSYEELRFDEASGEWSGARP